VRNYIDTIGACREKKTRSTPISRTPRRPRRDHFGLEKVKERIASSSRPAARRQAEGADHLTRRPRAARSRSGNRRPRPPSASSWHVAGGIRARRRRDPATAHDIGVCPARSCRTCGRSASATALLLDEVGQMGMDFRGRSVVGDSRAGSRAKHVRQHYVEVEVRPLGT